MSSKKNCLYILFYSITFLCCAQKNLENYQIGHYIDLYGNLIEGYYDLSYSPEEPLIVSYSVRKNYTVGRYYNLEHKRVDGYIELSENTSSIKFKASKTADEQNISAENCTALVLGADSFVVLNNVTFQGNIGAFKVKKPHFASVLDDFGPYSFYELYSSDLNNSLSTYLYTKRGSENLISFPVTKANFIKTASHAFRVFPALVNRIKDYDFTRSDIPSLVKMFKYYIYYRDGIEISFDESWNEVDISKPRTFFAEIISVNEEAAFDIKYYFEKDNILICQASLTSLYPNEYKDTTTYYYPNGIRRQDIIFGKGKAYQIISYHQNGKKHRVAEIGNSNPYFENVYDINGNSVFDKKGSGVEVYYDSIRDHNITYIYHKKDLVEAYYTENGKKVYQYCYSNARVKNIKYFSKILNNEITLTDSLLMEDIHGLVLLKFTVETKGEFSDIKVIKGLNKSIDESLVAIIKSKNTAKIFRPGSTHKNRITQEVVLPISFETNGFSYYKNNYFFYYDQYFIHQQNMMWMHQNTINNIPTISY